MGILKKILNGYKLMKESKEICCDNLGSFKKNVEVSLEKMEIASDIKIKEKRKKLFNEIKENLEEDKLIDVQAYYDYHTHNKITKVEFEKKCIIYNKLIEKTIKDVDNNKITHEDFFKIIFKDK